MLARVVQNTRVLLPAAFAGEQTGNAVTARLKDTIAKDARTARRKTGMECWKERLIMWDWAENAKRSGDRGRKFSFRRRSSTTNKSVDRYAR
jgi:hypothetical protein